MVGVAFLEIGNQSGKLHLYTVVNEVVASLILYYVGDIVLVELLMCVLYVLVIIDFGDDGRA